MENTSEHQISDEKTTSHKIKLQNIKVQTNGKIHENIKYQMRKQQNNKPHNERLQW